MVSQDTIRKALLSGALVCAVALGGCGQKPATTEASGAEDSKEQAAATESDAGQESEAKASATYEVDYGTSEQYKQEDIDAAIEVVMAEFDSWKGAEMKRIAFTDDATCAENVEYVNSLREESTPEFDEAMVLMSDFHSPSGKDAEGTAWNPDSDYDGWAWYLGRTDGGAWELLTWGYA